MATYFVNQFAAQFSQTEHTQDTLKRLAQAMLNGDTCISLSDDEIQTLQTQTNVAYANDSQPLVLDQQRLYTQRNWLYEEQLSSALTAMSQQPDGALAVDLDSYFTDEYQKQAAKLALTNQLAIITGGPGTGKTTTVVKILALLLQQNLDLSIALCAPTGKAAMRLQESIANGKQDQANVASLFSPQTLDIIPEKVSTIHRLLGSISKSVQFRHNQDNPLAYDIVVVDEASMIDLALMSKLVKALKPTTQLILLGDKDQLASVESGAVLADCYEGLSDNRVNLVNTYRFGGVIKDLAEAINAKDAAAAIDIIHNSTANTADKLTWLDEQNCSAVNYAKQAYKPYFQAVSNVTDNAGITAIFDAFNQFQVLSPTRYLLAQFNHLGNSGETWYPGKPIMIAENNRDLGLFNGDIGICMPDFQSADQALRIWFLQEGKLRSFTPARLPKHELAYAITIHKSQGSEFKQVLMLIPDVLPDEGLFTKELVYTAITRAKESVVISQKPALLAKMIGSSVDRQSGLADRLQS